MSFSGSLQEHWTDDKSAVVVTAEPSLIIQLVDELGVSGERPVYLSCSERALALWGEDLTSYLDWRNEQYQSSDGKSGQAKAI